MSNEQNFLVDGLQNCVTSVGIAGKDKRAATTFAANFRTQVELEGLFQSNDIAKKMVRLLPFDMTREGIEFCAADEKFVKFIGAEFKRIKIEEEIMRAMYLSRLYGGSLLYIFYDDGAEQKEPLDINKVKGIKFAKALDRYEVSAGVIDQDIFSGNFRLPKTYQVTSASNNMLDIHYSRVIRFDGAEIPWRLFQQNNYWHDSVLSTAWEPIVNYDGGLAITRSMMEDFRTKIIKLKGLLELLQAGKQELVKARLELFDYQSSILKACILQEGDEYENKTLSFASIPDVLDELKQRMVGASEMPHTKLFGTGPDGGIGATGNSEKDDWYALVKMHQEETYRPVLEQLIETMKIYGGFKGAESEFKFKSLNQPTAKETADTRLIVAQTDKIYLELGVYGEDEVAGSRWGSGEYSMETTLDAKTRRGISEADKRRAKNQEEA